MFWEKKNTEISLFFVCQSMFWGKKKYRNFFILRVSVNVLGKKNLF